MKNDFIVFNQYEDDLIEMKQQAGDVFAITLRKDLSLLPYVLFRHISDIKAKPINELYHVFGFPAGEALPTYLMNIRELETEGYRLCFCLYNISGKLITLSEGTEIGYVMATKSLVKEFDHAYYSNDHLLIRELKPNTIKNSKYVIDAQGRHSLVFSLNKHLFENPFAIDIDLENIDS